MRRFELVEGTSSKFWEVDVEGSDLTVRFGRIGTQGQTKTKTYTTPVAAGIERDKLVKEKTGKGYKEVGVAAGASLAAVKTAANAEAVEAERMDPEPADPEPAPAAVNAGATTATNAIALTTSASSTPAAIAWPNGGFQWTADLRAKLPPLRGIRPAPWPDAWTSPTPPSLNDRTNSPHVQTMRQDFLNELSQSLGRPLTLWSDAKLDKALTDATLNTRDLDAWLELQAQLMGPQSDHRVTTWVTARGIALHGIAFMIEATQPMWNAGQNIGSTWFHHANGAAQLEVLRAAIVGASEAAYEAALAYAEAQRGRDTATDVALAMLFPHLPWAAELVAAGVDDPKHRLAKCTMPAELAVQYFEKHWAWIHSDVVGLLLMVDLHGEAALDLLMLAVRRSILQGKQNADEALRLLARMHTPPLVDRLVALIDSKEGRALLDRLAESYPAAVLLRSLERALATRQRSVEGWAVRLALRKPDALAAARDALDADARSRLDALLAAFEREEVSADALPELLRNPPWLQKKRSQELPTLTIAPFAIEDRMSWSNDERAAAAKFEPPPYLAARAQHQHKGKSLIQAMLAELYIRDSSQSRILAGEPVQADDIVEQSYYYATPAVLLHLPDRAALAVWNSYPTRMWAAWGGMGGPVGVLLAKFGTQALPGLAAYAQSSPEDGLTIAISVDSAAIVPVALHALKNTKKARAPAAAWIRAHLDTTLRVALPLAFGADRANRDNAQYALRYLCQSEAAARVKSIAADYGSTMAAALQALLDSDPLLVLPARMPKLPAFFVPASFRRPELKSGGALPVAAAEHIGTMLAISKIDEPYAGLQVVKDTCDAASLADFAWDLFEAWLAGGGPSKEGWAFNALGHFGNDETARRLAPKIREWPGEAAHARAVSGLDLLAVIGTDMALMHLNAIANKVKFKGLQDRAREKIAAVAEARGFTAEELADRLVPDLGLDESGTLPLNFGERTFTVGFDETLKPFVRDAQGTRLKDLPKPIRTDDAALAADATERYKQLRKDAKAVAAIQVMRMELGMIARRRWPAADFRRFFLEHPLLRHLASRVVWGVYDDDRMTSAFRVAEDLTLADATDSTTSVADEAIVGIAHVLEMPPELQTAFGQVFADYEILQPFRQLGRETFRLTDEELRTNVITRFKDKTIATGSVMGLTNRGWNRGQAADAGWVGYFYRDCGDDLRIDLELDPGTVVGMPTYEPKQKIPKIVLRPRNSWNAADVVPLKRLDPVLASEVLRDAELLAPYQE